VGNTIEDRLWLPGAASLDRDACSAATSFASLSRSALAAFNLKTAVKR